MITSGGIRNPATPTDQRADERLEVDAPGQPPRPEPRLQPAVIGFDAVVAVLLGDVGRGRDQFGQDPQVRAGLVSGHLDRRRPVRQRMGEEPAGGRGVPLLGQQHVDDLPVLVDRGTVALSLHA